MEEKKKHPSLPSNYVTLADLQQRWLQQQKQQQPPPPAVEPQQPHQQQHQDQGDSHQPHATASRFSNESQLLVDAGIKDIDGDGDLNLEGKCSNELKERVKLKSKRVRVAEKGTKFKQEKEGKEKEEWHYQEDLHQQRHRGTAVRSFAGRKSSVKHRNHRKIRRDLVTYVEKQLNDADAEIGGVDANLESKGDSELEKNEKAKPKPRVYERGITTEEKKEDEDVKQERNGTPSRSFSRKQHRNARSYSRKVPAGTNAEKQCGDTGTGGGESMVNATAKQPLVEERKTEVEEVNGKKQKEEVNNAENEKAKIIESQSSEEKSGGCGSKMEEVEQRFRGLGFRRARDDFNYSQPRRGSYGGRGYGYSNRNGYRGSYGYGYGYGKRDFDGFRPQHYDESGKRGHFGASGSFMKKRMSFKRMIRSSCRVEPCSTRHEIDLPKNKAFFK
ncbi:hypothetical protein PIB30_064220 [Stylosanthes scabra]|uniref:Uncharacterized protein n=1 Tax=Stylosanthes scabra TaxID=79078 RepID=A0ABU6YKK7_9FABA|nr:hypothetical protein [Stylosanthes scabra]